MAKSHLFSGKASDPGLSTPEVGALLAVCALSIRAHVCVQAVCVCVCVRGYIQAQEPPVEPGEHKPSLGFVTDKTGRVQREQKPKALGMGFPRFFPLLLNFLYNSRTRRRFWRAPPAQPRPLLSSSSACPGNTSPSPFSSTFPARGPVRPLSLSSWRLHGAELAGAPLPALLISPGAEGQPLSEGGVRHTPSQIARLLSEALAPDFQINTHLLKVEPRRNCEEGLRCGGLGVRGLFAG